MFSNMLMSNKVAAPIVGQSAILFALNILGLIDNYSNMGSFSRIGGANTEDYIGDIRVSSEQAHRVLGGYYFVDTIDDKAPATPTSFMTRGGVVSVGDTLTKASGSNGWNADAYSTNSFTGSAYVEWVTDSTSTLLMLALNTDPTSDSSYTSLDYAFFQSNGTLQIYESGAYKGSGGTPAVGDVLSVEYSGTTITYSKNGILLYTTTVAPGLTLFMDSSFYNVGASVSGIKFAASKLDASNIPTELVHPKRIVNTQPVYSDVRKYVTSTVVPAGGSMEDGGRWYTSALGGTTAGATLIADTGVTDWVDNGIYNNGFGLLLEPPTTNLFVNPSAPATQTITLPAIGKYTLSVGKIGDAGTVIISAGSATATGYGTSSVGTDITIDCSAVGTVACSVAGSLYYAQLEAGNFATSFISGSRQTELGGLLFSTTTTSFMTRGGVVSVGDTLTKASGSNGWNADAYSTNSFTGSAYVEWVTDSTSTLLMLALNTDPTSDSSYTSLDYAFFQSNGTLQIYESGAPKGSGGTPAVGDVLSVEYSGTTITYSKNGILLYTTTVAPGLTLFMDSSFNTVGASVSGIKFAASKLDASNIPTGWAGTNVFPHSEGTIFLSIVMQASQLTRANVDNTILSMSNTGHILKQIGQTGISSTIDGIHAVQMTFTAGYYNQNDTMQFAITWSSALSHYRLSYRNASTGQPWTHSAWATYSGSFADTGLYKFFDSTGVEGGSVRNNVILSNALTDAELDGYITP